MLNFKTISKIFSDFLDNKSINFESWTKLDQLIRLNIETNKKLWDLEDSARMLELGSEHIAVTKQNIDSTNQDRNNLINKIDVELTNLIQIIPLDSKEKFYSESPGMIIDRLAILYIKLSVIKNLLLLIKEKDLAEEYKYKESIISKQINNIGDFLDRYLKKLINKEVYFEIQQPVKIYNDIRIKKYIKLLKNKK